MFEQLKIYTTREIWKTKFFQILSNRLLKGLGKIESIFKYHPWCSLRSWQEWVHARNFLRRLDSSPFFSRPERLRDRSSRGYPLPPATQATVVQILNCTRVHTTATLLTECKKTTLAKGSKSSRANTSLYEQNSTSSTIRTNNITWSSALNSPYENILLDELRKNKTALLPKTVIGLTWLYLKKLFLRSG